jgi:hypothetical protein
VVTTTDPADPALFQARPSTPTPRLVGVVQGVERRKRSSRSSLFLSTRSRLQSNCMHRTITSTQVPHYPIRLLTAKAQQTNESKHDHHEKPDHLFNRAK